MQNLLWYDSLIKPPFTPPDWLFLPTWIFLYLSITVSFFYFAKTGFSKEKVLPLSFFIFQLALNIIWSPVFFSNKNIQLAFIIICLLWVFLFFTIITFYRFSKTAAYLLIPYFLWVTFALYLNYGIYVLNSF